MPQVLSILLGHAASSINILFYLASCLIFETFQRNKTLFSEHSTAPLRKTIILLAKLEHEEGIIIINYHFVVTERSSPSYLGNPNFYRLAVWLCMLY